VAELESGLSVASQITHSLTDTSEFIIWPILWKKFANLIPSSLNLQFCLENAQKISLF
jgi:hypothetical protein